MSVPKQNYGEIFETADLTGGKRVAQPIIPLNSNKILRGVRPQFILFNPVYTSIVMRLYADQMSAPGKFLAESTNSRLKTDLQPNFATDPYAWKETYFFFDFIKLRQDVTYWLIPYAAGYLKSETEYIAWLKDWPEPAYNTNVNTTSFSQGTNPYAVRIFADDL